MKSLLSKHHLVAPEIDLSQNTRWLQQGTGYTCRTSVSNGVHAAETGVTMYQQGW